MVVWLGLEQIIIPSLLLPVIYPAKIFFLLLWALITYVPSRSYIGIKVTYSGAIFAYGVHISSSKVTQFFNLSQVDNTRSAYVCVPCNTALFYCGFLMTESKGMGVAQ